MWYVVLKRLRKHLIYNVCVRINGHCSDVNTKKPVVTYYTQGYVGREKYIGAKHKIGNLGRANWYLNWRSLHMMGWMLINNYLK